MWYELLFQIHGLESVLLLSLIDTSRTDQEMSQQEQPDLGLSLGQQRNEHSMKSAGGPSEPVSPLSDQLHSLMPYPLTQPDRLDDFSSLTSSIEELSMINQKANKRDQPQKSHFDSSGPLPKQQAYPRSGHYQYEYTKQTGSQQQQPHPGSTYIPHPPQPLASMSSNSMQPQLSSYLPEQQELSGAYSSSVLMKGGGQPLGIATATLALAHNAAASGDTATLVSRESIEEQLYSFISTVFLVVCLSSFYTFFNNN